MPMYELQSALGQELLQPPPLLPLKPQRSSLQLLLYLLPSVSGSAGSRCAPAAGLQPLSLSSRRNSRPRLVQTPSLLLLSRSLQKQRPRESWGRRAQAGRHQHLRLCKSSRRIPMVQACRSEAV